MVRDSGGSPTYGQVALLAAKELEEDGSASSQLLAQQAPSPSSLILAKEGFDREDSYQRCWEMMYICLCTYLRICLAGSRFSERAMSETVGITQCLLSTSSLFLVDGWLVLYSHKRV